jgi:hypothetical protein
LAARVVRGIAAVVPIRGREDPLPDPPRIAEGALPALALVSDAICEELDAQERRGDAIDTKAGLVLGLAGVLASIQLHSIAGAQLAALSLDGLAAVTALLALRPRPFPALTPRRIRGYAAWGRDQADLKILDTRIELYETTKKKLNWKANLLSFAFVTLLAAVVTTIVAAATS